MKIWHRVTFNKQDAVDNVLDTLGIRYKKTSGFADYYLLTFEIEESDPRWPDIETLIHQKGHRSLVNTTFTDDEILRGEWARMVPTFEQGYPQPESTWVKNPINYSDYCHQCGTFRQISGFRLKKEPIMGRNSFMTLHWGYANFCIPSVLQVLKECEIHGFEVWDAIINNTNKPSRIMSQIFTLHTAKPGLINRENLDYTVCPLCGITKYVPHLRGNMNFKREAFDNQLDIFQTHEWFGSGHHAHREVLVSNRLASLIIENAWQGIQLKVVEVT